MHSYHSLKQHYKQESHALYPPSSEVLHHIGHQVILWIVDKQQLCTVFVNMSQRVWLTLSSHVEYFTNDSLLVG